MEIKNLGKTVSVHCNVKELETLLKLKQLKSVTTTMVFRRGLSEYEAELSHKKVE